MNVHSCLVSARATSNLELFHHEWSSGMYLNVIRISHFTCMSLCDIHYHFTELAPFHVAIITLYLHFISKASYNWSKGWHVTSELELHQCMKSTTIQPRPLPETIFERHEKKNNTTQENNSWECGISKHIMTISIALIM